MDTDCSGVKRQHSGGSCSIGASTKARCRAPGPIALLLLLYCDYVSPCGSTVDRIRRVDVVWVSALSHYQKRKLCVCVWGSVYAALVHCLTRGIS
ncbi:unnamed protein product [Ixodes persulcatus]